MQDQDCVSSDLDLGFAVSYVVLGWFFSCTLGPGEYFLCPKKQIVKSILIMSTYNTKRST